jgi:type IV conjugative transfer system coupling protein TraD
MALTSHETPKLRLTKTLTKGGQVSLHNLRMVRQVLGVTLVLSLIGGILFWGIKTWIDYTPYQRYIIASAWQADIKLSVSGNKDRESQKFRYENGQEEVVQCLAIKNNRAIQLWVQSFQAQALKNAWNAVWFMGALFLAICVFWVWRGSVKKAKEVVSGSEIVAPATLQKILKSQNIASSFSVGGVTLRENSETQHMMVCGTTGTGKSTCFYQLFPKIREQGQRAIIVDTTGEFMSRFYRHGKDILLNPFDERSVGWSPWADCRFPYHYDELANAFIPQTGHDSFWSASARTVFAESLNYMARQGMDTDAKSVEALLHLLLETSLKDLHKTLQNTPAASLVDPAGDRTAMSIRSHLSPYLKGLRYLPADKPVFSVRDWVQNENENKEKDKKKQHKESSPKSDPQWLFIAATPDQRETLKPIMTGLMASAIHSLLGMPPSPTRRLWFIIDELVSLHKQEVLPKALAELRKYGGCIAVGIQNIPQLQSQYGHAETKSLTSLFNTKVIFRNGDPETAKHMSQMLGEQEVKEFTEGISYGAHQIRDGVSLNEQKRLKPVVSANDIMILDDLEAYLKLPGNLPVAKVVFEVDGTEKMCPGFVPVKEDEKQPPKKEKKGKRENKKNKGEDKKKMKKETEKTKQNRKNIRGQT